MKIFIDITKIKDVKKKSRKSKKKKINLQH